MSNRIEQYDLISKEALGTVEDVTSKLVSALDVMKNIAKEGVALNQAFKVPQGLEDTVKGVTKVHENTKKLTDAQKRLLDQQNRLAQVTQNEIKSRTKLNQKIIESTERTKFNNAQIRKQIQLQETQKGSLSRLEKELANNIARFKSLDLTEKKNDKTAKELLATIQKQDKAVKSLNSQLGRAQGNVGNYGSALAGVGKQFIGALGVTAGIAGFVAILKNAQKVVSDFSVAQSTLAALSGKTKEQLAGLTQQALDLGKSTEFTASQATNAQIELIKLGLSTQQIQASTPEILKFASATGAELPAAAKTAAVAMRAFGLDASKMGEITSALAVATTKSALSFQDYDTILSTLGPVAKAYGFSLEETIDLTGQLKNAGFDASSAATATRKILLNLANTNGDLAKSLGRPITNIKDLSSGLIELKNKGIDLADALELTDVKSVAAFSTFLEGAENLGQLTDSITNANAELDQMVEKRLDNLHGDTVKLSSAWEGFLLSIEDGNGIFSSLARTIVQFFTKILGGLTELNKHKEVIGKIAAIVVTYVAALKAQVLWAQKDVAIKALQNVAIKLQAKLTKQQTVATVGAEAAQKGLNAAMSANIFAAIATVILMAVQALVKWNKNLVKAKIDTKELTNNIAEESQETNNLFDILKRTTPQSKEYNEAKEKLNNLYPTLLAHYDLESGSLTEIEAAQKAANNEILRNIALKEKQNDIQEVAEKANAKFSKSIEKIMNMANNPAERGALASIVGDVTNQIKSGSISIEEGTKKIAEFLQVPEKTGGRTFSQWDMIALNLKNIQKQSSKLNEATQEIDTFYTALTGNVTDYKSIFESIDTAQAIDQLDEYLTSSDERIKKAAENRKILIDELNIAKPVIDATSSKKDLEDYLKSTNDLVKMYAEQRKAQLDLAEFNDPAKTEEYKKFLDDLDKHKKKIKIADPIKIDDIIDLDEEEFKFPEPDMSEAENAYNAFWNEQVLKARENLGLFSNNAKEREKQEAELAVKLLNIQKAQLQAEINNGYLSANEQIEAKLQIFDINQQLHDQEIANLEAQREKRKEITSQSIDLAKQSFDVISGFYSAQMSNVESLHNFEVATTEEGSKDRIKAEARYDEEKRKIEKKQAIVARASALFNIGISTAQAIMGIWKDFPKSDFGITAAIMSGVVAGLGAAQVAAVLATPLPAFEKGGTVLEDTLARVSEKGSELAILPSGDMFLTPESETIMHLPKGTDIKPNADPLTQQYLARQAYASVSIETNKTNKILEQIRDKETPVVLDGYKYTNSRGIKGKYKV